MTMAILMFLKDCLLAAIVSVSLWGFLMCMGGSIFLKKKTKEKYSPKRQQQNLQQVNIHNKSSPTHERARQMNGWTNVDKQNPQKGHHACTHALNHPHKGTSTHTHTHTDKHSCQCQHLNKNVTREGERERERDNLDLK